MPMEISSEMIHGLLLQLLFGTLGSRAFTVGLIEGLDESSALILKVFSGSLSGDSEKRKALACRCSWGLFSVAFVTVAARRLLDSHFFFKSLFKPSPILHNIGGIEFGSLSSDQ